MKKVASNQITYNQFIYLIVGTMIGNGILTLPSQVAKVSRQDGWISAFIGIWYPLYMVLAAIYFSKKHPDKDILYLSKLYFGKFFGSILALAFGFQFFFHTILSTAGLINVSRAYIVEFLSSIKLISLILLVGLYGTFQGLKVIGRVNEFIFYLMIILLFIPLMAFKDGSYLNISPIFGSGFKNILKASKDAGFAYAGVEIIMITWPYMNEKAKIKKAAIKSVFICAFIYTYTTFMTIYYIGPDIILKPYWPFMLINETVNLPFINSFRFIFMFFWVLIIFKTVINVYYGFAYCLSNAVKKLRIQKVCLYIYPYILYFTYVYSDEVRRRQLIEKFITVVTIFNIIYIMLLIILVHFRKGRKNNETL